MKKEFRFYSENELSKIKEATLKKGSLTKIAKELSKEMDRSFAGLYCKLLEVKRDQKKSQVLNSTSQTPVTSNIEEETGIRAHSGFQFIGIASKVLIYHNRFEVYF